MARLRREYVALDGSNQTNMEVSGLKIPMLVDEPNWIWRFGQVQYAVNFPGEHLLGKIDRVVVRCSLGAKDGKLYQVANIKFRAYPWWSTVDCLTFRWGSTKLVKAYFGNSGGLCWTSGNDIELVEALAREAEPGLRIYKRLVDEWKTRGEDVLGSAREFYGATLA